MSVATAKPRPRPNRYGRARHTPASPPAPPALPVLITEVQYGQGGGTAKWFFDAEPVIPTNGDWTMFRVERVEGDWMEPSDFNDQDANWIELIYPDAVGDPAGWKMFAPSSLEFIGGGVLDFPQEGAVVPP